MNNEGCTIDYMERTVGKWLKLRFTYSKECLVPGSLSCENNQQNHILNNYIAQNLDW